MENSQKELIEKLKHAQNVLVTVSRDPSVDQLSAAIGLTIALNNLDKHASAVFSGQVPSTMEFLQPEATLEKNTDSLRDFIIALDKSKADKLRYKVEDSVVRIFITPYKTSISQDDLEFSQGDFNVDIVVALGVHAQQDLDDAIQAHGRILHDAVIASVTLDGQSELGTLHISGNGATSLSELVTDMVNELDKKVLDSQAATALLTGIVSVTERFRNDLTTPKTMSISSVLMAAGANQQLIANELDAEPVEETSLPSVDEAEAADIQIDEAGTLAISHEEPDSAQEPQSEPKPEQDQESSSYLPPAPEPAPQVDVDGNGNLIPGADQAYPNIRGRVIEPPSHGGTLTANTEVEPLGKPAQELTMPAQANQPMLSHTMPIEPIDLEPEVVTPEPTLPIQPTLVQPQTEPQPLPPLRPQPEPQAQIVAPQPAPSPISELDISPAEPVTIPAPVFAPEPLVAPAPLSQPIQEAPVQAPAVVPPAPVEPQPVVPEPVPSQFSAPEPVIPIEPVLPSKTLADLERELGGVPEQPSPEPTTPTFAPPQPVTSPESLDNSAEEARKAVEAALAASQTGALDPIEALNAQPLGNDLHADSVTAPVDPFAVDLPAAEPTLVPDPAYERPESPSSFPGVMPESHQEDEGEAAPPVPPPFVPPTT